MTRYQALRLELNRVQLELFKIVGSVHGVVPLALINKRDKLERQIHAIESRNKPFPIQTL